MYCDKCHADGKAAKSGALHTFKTNGERCGGKFTLEAPPTEAKREDATTTATSRSATVIAGTKALPAEVMARALRSPRAGSGGGQASNAQTATGSGSADASAKAQPSVTPRLEQPSLEETQFNTDLVRFRQSQKKAGAALEGADPSLLANLKRLEDGIEPARNEKNWARANRILEVAHGLLKDAIASAAAAATNNDGGAGTAITIGEEPGEAEKGKSEFGEALKAVGQALRQAAAIRKRPVCPADDDMSNRWDRALKQMNEATGQQRWEDAQEQLSALVIVAAALQNASEEEAKFSAALLQYQTAKSSAVLQGAGADPMARMEQADKDIDSMRAVKRWTQAVALLGSANTALDEAVASAAAKKAYDDSRLATEKIMREVDAVADWPAALQEQLGKLGRLRQIYATAASQHDYDKAARCAKVWQQEGEKLLEDKRQVDAQKRAYEEAAAQVQALRTQGAEVRAMTPCPAVTQATAAWDRALQVHDAAKTEQEWVKALELLAGVRSAAAPLNDARAAMADFKRQEEAIALVVAQARAFAGDPNIQGTASTWRDALGSVTRLSDAKNWSKATEALASLKSASEDLSTKGQGIRDRAAAENAVQQATSRNALNALTGAVHGHRPDDLARFNTESAAYVDMFNTGRYVEAKSHVLAADQAAKLLLDAMAAHDRYKLVATVAATGTTEEALNALKASKGSAPTQDRFAAARSLWVAAFNAQNWPEATKTFRDLLAASELLLDDAAYQAAYDKATKDAVTAAERQSTYPPVGGTQAAAKFALFGQAREKLNAALQALDFQAAKKCVPTMKSTADGLLTALGASTASDLEAFDKGWKQAEPKLKSAREAKALAGTSIPALEVAWRAVLAAQTAMDKAKDAKQWVQACAALAALDRAAVSFDAKYKEGLDFDKAYTPIKKKSIADALSIAKEALPHLAADSKAYTDLHRSTMSSIGAGNYVQAKPQLVELERLAEALVAKDTKLGAKDSPNGKHIRQLLADAQAVKDRLVEPARDFDKTAIASATERAHACIQHLAAATPDVESAQKELAQAQAQFTAAEKARKLVWDDYFKKANTELKAAEESAKALDKDLKALRNKAVEAGMAAIQKAATRMHFGSATAKTGQLIEETKTWLHAKQALDALSPAAKVEPDVDMLKELVGRTGGGKVLDAIVEARTQGQGISSQLVNVALEARFGFKAQRFEQRNTSGAAAAEEGNTTEKKAAYADKSIVQTYKVLAKVPQQHWTAKVNDMIVYDKNDNAKSVGGHFSRVGDKRKIYMYCGQPEDAHKQKFGKGQKVLPEDEVVEESCQPRNEDPAPLFDFTLLHEAAHAEDDARSYMDQNGGKADHGGWQVHKGPDAFAAEVAKHFGYDEAYILATLQSPSSSPPRFPANLPQGGHQTQWDQAREDALAWCRSVREDAQPWEDPALSRAVAIQGRVYQESAAGKWVSYDLAARARGISSYQFRSPGEWFAELYAAYFSKKLKPNHPSAKWLKTFKSATAKV